MKMVSFDADGKLRVIIERIGDRIIVYTNQNPTVAFNIVNNSERKIMRLGKFKGQGNNRMEITRQAFWNAGYDSRRKSRI